MGYELKTNTAVRIPVGPLVDPTDGKTAETELTAANLSVQIYRMATDGGAVVRNQFNPTASGVGDNDMFLVASSTDGMYDLELTAAQLNWYGNGRICFYDLDGFLVHYIDIHVVSANYFNNKYGATVLNVNVAQISLDGTAADNLELALENGTAGYVATDQKYVNGTAQAANASGTSDSGTTGTMVDSARTEADTNYWKGSYIRFTNGTISGQTRLITGFTPASDTITFAPVTTQAVSTHTYEIIPAANIDLVNTVTTLTGHTNQTGDSYAVVAHADHGNAKLVRSTTPANKLDVSATGEAGLDFNNIKVATGATTLTNITIPTCTTNTDTAIALATAQADLDLLTGEDGATLASLQGNYAPNIVVPDVAGTASTLHGTTDGKIDTAQADLDLLTGEDGATLASLQANYAPNIVVPDVAGTGATLESHLTDIKGATFSGATDSLEAVRNRGDSAWTTGAGGSDRLLMIDTTIATLATQVSFTLTAGSTDDDAYNNCTIVIEDVSTSTQKAVGVVSDYTGATKTVTLKYDPAIFTMAITDKIYILAENALKTTVANRQLDVTATGAAGIDWGNVENKTTANDLTQTDIQLCDTITTYTGDTPQTADHAAAIATAQSDLDKLTGADGATLASLQGNYAPNIVVPDVAGTAATLHGTTDGKVDTAQSDLDKLTGADGATLASLQGNYAPNIVVPDVAGTAATLHGTTDGKVDTAQSDLDKLTGADGATLASLQGNYAPNIVVPDVAGTAATLHGTTDGKVDAAQTDLDTLTDAAGEPAQGAPPASASMKDKINYIYKFLRNKVLTTSTQISVYNDAADTVDHKSTISDDDTTYTRGEFGTGP